MKVGVREFLERLSEVVNGQQPVVITSKGKVVGEFTPAVISQPDDAGLEWLEARAAFRKRWQSETPDWRERLLDAGLDDEGDPLVDPAVR
jgi:antitoxin (DNA-binding transcriptional repressor) of toxin-antitoxin stability system